MDLPAFESLQIKDGVCAPSYCPRDSFDIRSKGEDLSGFAPIPGKIHPARRAGQGGHADAAAHAR
jgi:hypothetical protein